MNFYSKFLIKLKMNIFFLDLNTKECAKMMVNSHVVKMILEHTQLLCSVHHIINSEYKPPYKLTHKNHPCAIWVRESLSNYLYLIELTLEICKEYTHRYGKTHKCEQYVSELKENLPEIPDIGFTTPALAMPNEYKEKDPVTSYRNYYIYGKTKLHIWKNREKPEWFNDYLV